MLGDLGGLASLAGVNLANDQEKIEAKALLVSRRFTESFIADENLLPVLFTDRWDADAQRWRRTWRHPDPPTLYDGYRYFDQKVRAVIEDRKTGIITLSIDWTDREVGASWANELVRRLNETMRTRAVEEADAAIALLSEQLKTASQLELQQSIARGIETYVKQRALAMVRPEYAFRVLDPAQATGPNDYIAPRRALYIVSGLVVGCLVGAFVAMALERIRTPGFAKTV